MHLPNDQYFYFYRLPVKILATSQMCVSMAESDRQHASTMESLEESDTASLDLSCESSIFDEEEENTNEINSIEVEVENENIGVNPYQFEPYDSDSSSSQTQDSNSDESDHDRLENTDW